MDFEENKELKEMPRPKISRKKAGIVILVVLAAVLLIGWNIKLSVELGEIANQQSEMQGQLSGVSSSLSGSFSGFAQEIQDMLKAQDSILADFSVNETARDLKAGTIQYDVSATPKTDQQGMTVSFVINDGKSSTEIRGTKSNHAFTAHLSSGFTDNIIISVLLKQGDKTQIQVITKNEGLLSETMLLANDDLWSSFVSMKLQELITYQTSYESFFTLQDYQGMITSGEVKRLDYYILVNNKIVVSAVGKPGTQDWSGDIEQVVEGFNVKVPLKFLETLKFGDRIDSAVVITDATGRKYCAGGSGLKVGKSNQSLIFETDEQYVFDRAFGVDF